MGQKNNLTFSVNRNWVIVFALILLIAGVALLVEGKRGSLKPSPAAQSEVFASPVSQTIPSNWKTFENKKYNISFKYPPSWSVIPSTQVFENGDVVAVQYTGKTQRQNTELYDGARFVVMVPQSTNLDLNSWVNSKHSLNVNGTPPQISNTEINGMSFKKVYECGLGCFTYYYTVIRGQVYGISVFADGPQKVELEETIEQTLKTLVLPR